MTRSHAARTVRRRGASAPLLGRGLSILSITLGLVVVGCADDDPIATSPTTGVGSTTAVSTSTSVVGADTTTASSTTTRTIPVALPIANDDAPSLELLFTLPGDGTGVTYTGDLDLVDFPISGPQAISMAPDGSIWMADTQGLRIVRLDQTGSVLVDVHTDADGVGPIFDVAAHGQGVYALEIVAALDRYRIISYSQDGEFLADYSLPEPLHLGGGLSGIEASANGDLWIELESGWRVFSAFDATGRFDPVEVDGYTIDGTMVTWGDSGDGFARMAIGDTTLEFAVRDTGVVRFEGAAPGVFGLFVEDVAFADVVMVDVRLAVVNRDGEVLAEAIYPLDEVDEIYVPQDFLSIAPDGRMIGLVPREHGVDVAYLTLYPPGHFELAG